MVVSSPVASAKPDGLLCKGQSIVMMGSERNVRTPRGQEDGTVGMIVWKARQGQLRSSTLSYRAR